LTQNFGSAYAVRAIAFSKLKEYRQAIRDYDKVLELKPAREAARISYSDRRLAKVSRPNTSRQFWTSLNPSRSGCKETCGSYDNWADAYLKLHNYPMAIEDISSAIKLTLSSAAFLTNIDQSRRIYPGYDSVADERLCERLRTLFFPAMSYADFAKQFLIDAKDDTTGLVSKAR
jgi:tetratricopeptide (TPR) repeat protein